MADGPHGVHGLLAHDGVVSNAHGADVASRPISPEDVTATVYHHLGIDGENTTFDDLLGRPIPLIAEGKPIRELFA